jgi:hypothetical protein
MKDTNKISEVDMMVIYRVAETYGFNVFFDGILDRLTINGSSRHSHENFYWDSDNSFEDFFTELQRFFTDESVEMYRQKILNCPPRTLTI